MARPRPFLHHTSPPFASIGVTPTRDAAGEPYIRLQTLGAATILVGETRVSASAGTLFALLLRVALSPGMLVSRAVLLSALWPDQPEVRRRANLRQALYKLRSHGARIASHGDVVQLDASQVLRTFAVDRSIESFERDVTHGHEPFGVLLPGLLAPSLEQQEWLERLRELVHADVRRVLLHQLRTRRDRADWGGADALARWLLQFDPLNEEATLTIAECTALSGSKQEAIAILDRYLAELGPSAGEIRLPAAMLRRRIAEPPSQTRRSFAPTERHFVGREQELADLTMAMRRARWHDSSAVLVHGPSGMGKTRLAHELEKVAIIEGVRVVQTACRESDVQRTLSVFLDIVPELLTQSGALGCEPESLTTLRRLVPADRASAMAAGGVPMPERDLSVSPVEREPMPMVSSLRRAIVDLVSAVSDEKPMLLIVDDAHWIDEHSWEVLAELIDRADLLRVFLLITSREPHARLTRPQRVPLGLQVRALGPLSPESCLALSRAIGDDLSATVSDELGAWFVRASEGIPLFLRSLVNHWIETGEAGGVPPTLRGVIEQRLSRLSGDALRVLQTAALLGKWATAERVSRTLELRANDLIRCIEQIETLGALSNQPSGVLIAHELVGRAARQGMSRIASETLRRRVAEILFSDASAASDPEILLDALELVDSIDDEDLLTARTIAHVEQIVGIGLPDRGLSALQRVDTSRLNESQRRQFASATAKLLLNAGDYAQAFEVPLNGLSLPQVSTELSDSDADTALSLVDSASRADPIADRIGLADFAIALAELPHLKTSTRLRAADIGLIIISNECDPVRARRLFDAVSISDAEVDQNPDFQRVSILFHTHFGDRQRADQLASLLHSSAQSAGASPTAYHAALRAGFARRLVGTSRSHLDSLELAFQIASQVAIPLHGINAAWQLAQSYLELGDTREFRKWEKVVGQLFSEVGDPIVCNYAVGLFCRSAIESGDPLKAKEHFLTYERNLPRAPSTKSKAYVLGLEMGTHLLNERWVPTDAMLSSLLARYERVCAYGTSDFLTSVAIDALARVGRRADAESIFARYLAEWRRERGPLGMRLKRVLTQLEIHSERSITA
jgi:DNA-binding SARP family transcriptional activator